MIHKKVKGIVIGALIGTLVGSLSAQLFPQRKKIITALINQAEWIEKAKNVGASVFNELHGMADDNRRKKTPIFMFGALGGVLLGAAASLLILTSKNGGRFRNNLTKQYQHLTDKTQDFMEYINDGLKKASKRAAPAHRAPLSKRKIKSKS